MENPDGALILFWYTYLVNGFTDNERSTRMAYNGDDKDDPAD